MKKTIPTSIANTLFYIEEDTYKELEDYLASIRQHFAGQDDSIEIIHDIEDRIREQFISYTEASAKNGSGERIITKEHVAELIKTMGRPEDFGDDATTGTDKNHRKLYRDIDNAKVAGVAAGLGAFLGIDPVVIRILFIVSVFLGGAGILAYIILWIAVPEAKTTAQKLEMQGDPVNIKSMKEKVSEVKDSKNLRNMFTTITHGTGTVLGGIIGIAFKIIAGIAYVGIISAFLIALFNSHDAFLNLPIGEFMSLPIYYIAISVIFLVSIIPFIFISTLGSMMLRKKAFFTGSRAGLLLGVWIGVIILGIVIAATSGTRLRTYISTSPSYTETTQVIPLTAYTSLIAANGQNITIVSGKDYSASITGIAAEIERVKFDVAGSTLNVHNTNIDDWHLCLFCRHMSSRITLTVPSPLTSIAAQNASVVNYTGTLGDINVKLENASKLYLSGTGKNFTATLENASRLDAGTFIANSVALTMQNASKADVNATATLSAHLKNASHAIQHGAASTENANLENGSRITVVKGIQ